MPDGAERVVRRIADVLRVSAQHFIRERAPEAAATISFFTIFSLFPVLLILAAIGGSLIDTLQAQERIIDLIVKVFPIERELIRNNLTRIVNARGAVSAIGLVALLWAATNAFDALIRNINRAWIDRPRRGIIKTRLAALGVVAGLAGVLAVLLLVEAAIAAITKRVDPPAADTFMGMVDRIPSEALLLILAFLILLAFYRLAPSARVRWIEAMVGAGAAAVAFVAATGIFSWYLGSGLARYNVVYGSLGAFLALLSWIYIVTLITLGGAHIAAGVAAYSKNGNAKVRETNTPGELC